MIRRRPCPTLLFRAEVCNTAHNHWICQSSAPGPTPKALYKHAMNLPNSTYGSQYLAYTGRKELANGQVIVLNVRVTGHLGRC